MALAKKKLAKKTQTKAAKKSATKLRAAPRASNILKWHPPSLVSQVSWK